jgi:hypothetical protein
MLKYVVHIGITGLSRVKIHKTVILPAILYGGGTYSLTLSEVDNVD